ncbi:type IV pilus modification protein PilV [Neisseriaceae bacterium B1]
MKSNLLIAKKKMQGATIIEVMVSVFLLTFGILALMLAQVRSVAGVGEAENRTLVAQAAESLAEGMQINPTLAKNGNVIATSYNEYTTIAGNGRQVDSSKNFANLASISANTKQALAQAQLDNFEAALNQIPDVSGIRYAVCVDNNNPAEPTLNGNNFQANCVAGGGETVIKVAWEMKDVNSNDANQKTAFTYVLKVKG